MVIVVDFNFNLFDFVYITHGPKAHCTEISDTLGIALTIVCHSGAQLRILLHLTY